MIFIPHVVHAVFCVLFVQLPKGNHVCAHQLLQSVVHAIDD